MAIEKKFSYITFSRIKDLVDFPLPDKLREIIYVANCTNFRLQLLQKYGRIDIDIDLRRRRSGGPMRICWDVHSFCGPKDSCTCSVVSLRGVKPASFSKVNVRRHAQLINTVIQDAQLTLEVALELEQE